MRFQASGFRFFFAGSINPEECFTLYAVRMSPARTADLSVPVA